MGESSLKRKAVQEDSISHPEANAGVDPNRDLLPAGQEINSVGGVLISREDVRNALQLLDFCSVFRKVLSLKNTQGEDILKDIFNGRTRRRGKRSVTAQFLIDMLTEIKKEQGEDCTRSPASGENTWFCKLKEFLSGSQSVLKARGLGCLNDIADYETLNPSQKLKLLNVLCDEILATARVKNWIDQQCEEIAESFKDAKKKRSVAKQEEKDLKQKIKAEVAEAIIAKNGANLSVSEHKAILSRFESETAKARAKVLESEVIVEKHKKQPTDAVRLQPIFQCDGHSYWKPKISGEKDIICQTIGTGDNTLTLDEEWSTFNAEEKEVIEKHISAASSSRGKARKL